VINMVYSMTLKKWLYMDATFEVYLQDEKGVLLSPAEVRNRLISGDTIVVAPELNWNGKPYSGNFGSGPAGYLMYMAKNSFWYTSPLHSKSSYETNGKPVYIGLAPASYPFPDFKTGADSKNILTHNPNPFWRAPLLVQ
jgi:hypothetical protein